MQKQKSGHIINMASVFGIKMFAPGGTVYCAGTSVHEDAEMIWNIQF
jgi:NADP-dependent 3-hydroxy acid dehydrogenase YdfG